jgi:hypothetical protein
MLGQGQQQQQLGMLVGVQLVVVAVPKGSGSCWDRSSSRCGSSALSV